MMESWRNVPFFFFFAPDVCLAGHGVIKPPALSNRGTLRVGCLTGAAGSRHTSWMVTRQHNTHQAAKPDI